MKTPRRFYAPRIPLKQIQERILPFIFHRTREEMQGIKRNFVVFKRGIRKTILFPKCAKSTEHTLDLLEAPRDVCARGLFPCSRPLFTKGRR